MAKVLHPIDSTHNLYQFTDGFLFGTDAVLLSGFVNPKQNAVGVEFGTGTGIIPLLLSIHKDFKKIYALEIQEEYALLAKENIDGGLIGGASLVAEKFAPIVAAAK